MKNIGISVEPNALLMSVISSSILGRVVTREKPSLAIDCNGDKHQHNSLFELLIYGAIDIRQDLESFSYFWKLVLFFPATSPFLTGHNGV